MLLNQLEDKRELFSLYAQLIHAPKTVSSTDLWAARSWIDVAECFQDPTILLTYKTALQLLAQHLAALPSLPQHLNIINNLTSSLRVDVFSACLHKDSSAHIVKLFE